MPATSILIAARLNPMARGSLAAGMSPQQIASTIWMGNDELNRYGVRPGQTVRVQCAGSDEGSSRSGARGVVASVALADGELASGTVLMAAGGSAAALYAADTQASGTPTFKGISVQILRADVPLRTLNDAAAAVADLGSTDQAASTSTSLTIRDAVCTACGCICDDIHLRVDSQRITAAENACELGRSWFLKSPQGNPNTQAEEGDCWIDGAPASQSDAIHAAAAILSQAKNPLVYGLSDTTCEAQRAAVDLADLLRANLDTTTSTFHGPTVMGLQAAGESTCTLGEIRDRADLVMLWGVNPLETDPRHYSRYSLLPAGRFVPRGRADRYCVAIDVRHTPTCDYADQPIRIKPSSDFEVLCTLRSLCREIAPDPASVLEATGVELAVWKSLFERMRTCRYGVILYGTGITQTRGKHLNCEALLSLVAEMNRHTRFVCKAMRGPGNPTGGDNVLTWRTGYPFGVNFSRGYPRYGPGEYTAADLLARREVDAALIVASDPSANFGPSAIAHLNSIPTVVLDARSTPVRARARVAFATSAYGLHTGGTVYRMDEIPLALRPALASTRPSDVEILERLAAAIDGSRASSASRLPGKPEPGERRP